MKKSLLIITAILWVVALYGQAGNPILMKTQKDLTAKADRGLQKTPAQKQSQHIPKAGYGFDVIGSSYHKNISNSSARNTASMCSKEFSQTNMAAVWTLFSKNPYTECGTGYNHCDPISPHWDFTWQRVENIDGNAGYPTHTYTENGEIIVSHASTNQLIVLTREQQGEGEWKQQELFEEEYPNGLWWPTLCANGNTVHLVALYDCDYGDEVVNPVYYRSQDGGKTWDIRAYTFPEIPQMEKDGMFADNYTITAKGNHVVFTWVMMDNNGFVGHSGNVGYVESFDGGNTWTYKKVYDCNFENDKPALIARGVAAAIDASDAVHIAFNAILVDNQYWYTFDGGIIYWKSTKEVLTQASFGIEYEKTGDEFNITKLGYLKYPNFIYHPELLGYDYWTVWPGATPEMADGYNKQGTVYNPRMVVEDGKVYLSYGSIIEQPMVCEVDGKHYFFRGVFLTVSVDNGETFDQLNRTSWISYHPWVFFCDWCDYEGPVGIPGEFEINTIVMNFNSDNGWPTMAQNVANGRLLFQWGYDVFPAIIYDESDIIICSLWLRKEYAGKIKNTREIWWTGLLDCDNSIKNTTGSVRDINLYPNPTTGELTINNEQLIINNIEVYDIYGRKVGEQFPSNLLEGWTRSGRGGKEGWQPQADGVVINISHLASGIYFVKITTENGAITKKVIKQ